MTTSQLIIAASEHDADMLYASGIFVPDPFIAIRLAGRWHGLLSPLEIDRARRQSKFDQVHLDTPWREKVREHGWQEGLAFIAAVFLKAHGVSRVEVPGTLALTHAEQLRSTGIEVLPTSGSLFPQRAIKSEVEIRHLAKAERLTRESMRQAELFIAACGIDSDGVLTHPTDGKRVKAEHIRAAIEGWLVAHGAMPSHTIVACGRQGADPHNIGSGLIHAGRPIIIDIFPRVVTNGYWGDMTRSYVKGKAPEEVKAMYRAVREAQNIGLSMVADGVRGSDIHRAIVHHFDDAGFRTGTHRGLQTGFFHGTGHGVGLEIHEAPRISVSDELLKHGQVVTIEPGLYYPQIGGIRLEDLVVVRDHGCENLTRHPRRLEIP